MNIRASSDSHHNGKDTAEAVKSALRDVASNAGSKFYNAYSHSKDRVDHAIDAASDGVERAEELLIKRIKENPVSAAAIALSAGVVIGMMISRRHRS